MGYGALTTEQITPEPLKSEFVRLHEQHKEDDKNFKSLFCRPTKSEYVVVNQRAARFHRLGDDTARPEADHKDDQRITLTAPIRYGHKAAVTRVSIDNGLTNEDIREMQTDAMAGDNRLVSEWCVRTMLTDGQWWDGTATPPVHKSTTFGVTHTHYLAFDVGGVPTLAHFNRGRHLIEEHGFTGDLVAFMNSNEVEDIENIAEWATAPGPMPTKLLEDLQKLGMTPSFRAGSMPIIAEDWLPETYGLVTSLQEKPMHWRNPLNNAGELEMYDNLSLPDVAYIYDFDLTRYCSATVTKRGMGVAMYFAGDAYESPSFDGLEL